MAWKECQRLEICHVKPWYVTSPLQRAQQVVLGFPQETGGWGPPSKTSPGCGEVGPFTSLSLQILTTRGQLRRALPFCSWAWEGLKQLGLLPAANSRQSWLCRGPGKHWQVARVGAYHHEHRTKSLLWLPNLPLHLGIRAPFSASPRRQKLVIYGFAITPVEI
jgi:hypothetical protein